MSTYMSLPEFELHVSSSGAWEYFSVGSLCEVLTCWVNVTLDPGEYVIVVDASILPATTETFGRPFFQVVLLGPRSLITVFYSADHVENKYWECELKRVP